ncbi:MAG: DUF445 family protein [Treponema sp.]|nr:DUF445 family protein [Treponema sp.]
MNLSWLIPPLVGGFIGYMTNMVAIRMLFRPHSEVRILGLRLPFTPGILPRQRDKLALSIGRMVEQELLSEEVLRRRLEGPELQEKTRAALGAYTGEILDRPLTQILEEEGQDFPLRDIVGDFVNSRIFETLLEEIIRSRAKDSSLLNRYLHTLFAPAARDLIKNGLSKEINRQGKGDAPAYREALERVLERRPGLTVREFISLDEGHKGQVDAALSRRALGTLEENLDKILQTIDIKKLVIDRINSLDMIRVEKMILDIMADQLKWINLFGAFLGALIGAVQVFLSFFL